MCRSQPVCRCYLHIMFPASFLIVPPWCGVQLLNVVKSRLQKLSADMDLCWVETAVSGCTAQLELGHHHCGAHHHHYKYQYQQHQPTTTTSRPTLSISLSLSSQPICCNCNRLHSLTNQVQKISKSSSFSLLQFFCGLEICQLQIEIYYVKIL